MKTIFEKIIDREIPADIVYEDDISMAFLDINPVTKGHTLLISKHPYPWMTDVPPEILGELFIRVQKIMIALKKGLSCDYVRITIVGTDIPHFHVHLIPQYIQDSTNNPDKPVRPHESYTDNSEKQTYIDNIKNNL